MIKEAFFRRLRLTSVFGLFAFALIPLASVQAGGWWNHKSVVAVPTGPAVGTVTGAAPYQIYTAPAAAPAAMPMPVAQAPAFSMAPAAFAAPTYSYAAPAQFSAPAQMVQAPVSYGMMVPIAVAPAQAAAPAAFGAAAPQNNNDDLVRELSSRLKASAPAPQAAAQSPAAAAANLSNDELLRELSRRANLPAPTAAAAPQATMNFTAPVAAQAMTPVMMGYSYQAAAPQAVQTVAPAQGTMSLIPVQLYKQKSFLGHDKLYPVNVYPYGVR